jgi:hypothetical protein
MAEANDNNSTLKTKGGISFSQTITDIIYTDFEKQKAYPLPFAKVFKMYKLVVMDYLVRGELTPSFEDFVGGKIAPSKNSDETID